VDLTSLPQYDFIIFGIPTWNYGELQEDWDDRWEDLDETIC
jgi:flavodoxin II